MATNVIDLLQTHHPTYQEVLQLLGEPSVQDRSQESPNTAIYFLGGSPLHSRYLLLQFDEKQQLVSARSLPE